MTRTVAIVAVAILAGCAHSATTINPIPTMTCPVGYHPAQKYTVLLGERALQTACLKEGDTLADGCYVIEVKEGVFWGCDGRKMSSDYPTLDEVGICHRRESKAYDSYCQNPLYEVGDHCWLPVCGCPHPPGYDPGEFSPCLAKEMPREKSGNK